MFLLCCGVGAAAANAEGFCSRDGIWSLGGVRAEAPRALRSGCGQSSRFFFFVIMFSEILVPEKMSNVPEKYFLHTIKGPCGLMIFLFSDFSFLSPPAELRTVYLVHRRDRCNYPQERRGL